MNTYVIVAKSPHGDKKIIWVHEDNYENAKNAFEFGYPGYEPISMWLRVRSYIK